MWCDSECIVALGICCASSAIRLCFVETVSGADTPCVFPIVDSVSLASLSLRRVPWGEFPAFSGTVQRSDSLAAHTLSAVVVPRASVPCDARCFVPDRCRALPRSGLGVVPGVPHRPCFTQEDSRVSQVPGDPAASVLGPLTPALLRPLALAVPPFCLTHGIGQRVETFSGLNPGPTCFLCTLHGFGCPGRATLGSRLVASLCRGWVVYQRGSIERFLSIQVIYFLLSQA
jgi:hypothetical protein